MNNQACNSLINLKRFRSRRKARTIEVGDVAPDFSLSDPHGRRVQLRDFRGKVVVLYFYPKDNTPGCIVESSEFRDHYADFTDAGAEVIGISSDTPESHLRFASKYRLPFYLLSDRDNSVRKAYGVPPTLGIIPGRMTFVIDKDGIVRHVFSSQFSPKSHVTEAMEVLARIQKSDRVAAP